MELLNLDSITLGADILMWITLIEIPAFSAMCLYMVKANDRTRKEMEEMQMYFQKDIRILSERLATYKVEVADKYASHVHLKDVELRLTRHLFRIEKKLDRSQTR